MKTKNNAETKKVNEDYKDNIIFTEMCVNKC